MLFFDVEECRYLGKVFDPAEVPEEFKATPLGSFEVKVEGEWRRCAGSYWSPEGPMVWVEAQS